MRSRSLIVAAIAFGVFATAGTWLAAQHDRPPAGGSRLSPRRTATGTVDGCAITIEYGAPSKRGRVIWGGLRPWNRWWMPGADRATSITTTAPLVIGGSDGTLHMPAGAHTIYMLPSPDTSMLIINDEVGQFHTTYDPSRDLGRVPMTLTRLAKPVEQMTFTIAARPSGGGALTLAWDDRAYSVDLAGGAPAAGAAPSTAR